MRVINLVRDLKPIRMGIWKAAVNPASELYKKYDVSSEIWFEGTNYSNNFHNVTLRSLPNVHISYLKRIISDNGLDPKQDIILSHGPWGYQTIWGNYLSGKGFKWIFIPQGTLEPWSLSQKWLKKKLYFEIFEKKRLLNANIIQASSSPEKINLQKLFPEKSIVLIPNGVEVEIDKEKKFQKNKMIFFFMARLHHKKGIVPLVNAWISSVLNNNPNYELIIAGPDDGELSTIEILLQQTKNARYIGSIYGDEKRTWLQNSSFYVLPSYSEGFPSSLIEAAAYGLIPLITDGCNFPELFNENLAIKITTEIANIRKGIEKCAAITKTEFEDTSKNLQRFIRNNYNSAIISQQQYDLFNNLLKINQ